MDFYLLSLFLSFIVLFSYMVIYKNDLSLFDLVSIILISVTPVINIMPLIYLSIYGTFIFFKRRN